MLAENKEVNFQVMGRVQQLFGCKVVTAETVLDKTEGVDVLSEC